MSTRLGASLFHGTTPTLFGKVIGDHGLRACIIVDIGTRSLLTSTTCLLCHRPADKVLALSSAVTDHDEEMMPDEDNMPLSTAEVHHRRSSLGSAVPPPALPGLQAPHQIHAPAASAAAAHPPS